MRQRNVLSRTMLIFGSIGLFMAASAISERASAQVYYQCPYGYAYLEGYGCEPLSYFYGPPVYAYPNYGFGFFYGGGWGRGYGGGWGRGYGGGGGRGYGGGGGHGGRR